MWLGVLVLVAVLVATVFGLRALDDFVTCHMGGLTLADPTPELVEKYGLALVDARPMSFGIRASPADDRKYFGPIVVHVDPGAERLEIDNIREGDWFAEAGEDQFQPRSVKELKSYLGSWKACSANAFRIVYVYGRKDPRHERRRTNTGRIMLSALRWFAFRPGFAPEWIPEDAVIGTTLFVQYVIAIATWYVHRKRSTRPRLFGLWLILLCAILMAGELMAVHILRADYAIL